MITFTQGSVRVELPVEAEHGPAPRYLPIPGTATPPLVEMPDDDESPEQHLATVDVFGEEVSELVVTQSFQGSAFCTVSCRDRVSVWRAGVMLGRHKQVGNGKTHVRQMVLSPGLVEALRSVQDGCARGEGHDLVEFPAEERRSLPSARERLLQLASEARAAVNGVTHPSLAVKRITDPGNVVYQVWHSLGSYDSKDGSTRLEIILT